MRILICGTSGLVRDALGELLVERRELEVLGPAGSAQEAVALVEAHVPDVIVIATTLPPMGGAEAARQIMSRRPSAKIVGLLAERPQVHRQAMMEAGAVACVAVDEPFGRLMQVIEDVAAARGRGGYLHAPSHTAGLADSRDPSADEAGILGRLSEREREVLKLVAEGYGIREISASLELSPKTVDAHRRRVMNKLKVENMADLTRLAAREGLIEP